MSYELETFLMSGILGYYGLSPLLALWTPILLLGIYLAYLILKIICIWIFIFITEGIFRGKLFTSAGRKWLNGKIEAVEL